MSAPCSAGGRWPPPTGTTSPTSPPDPRHPPPTAASSTKSASSFELGRFELPVTISALVWSAAALFVLVAPAFSRAPLVIVGGALVVGSAYFVGLFTLRRNVLATEPGT